MPEGQHALRLGRLLLILHPDKAIVIWEGQTRALMEGLTLIRCGDISTPALSCIGQAGPLDMERC